MRQRMRPTGFPASWFDHVEGASELVTVVDDADRIVYVNASTAESLTDSPAQVYDLVDPEYRDDVRRAVTAARRTGLPQKFDSCAAAPTGGRSRYTSWVVPLAAGPADGLVAMIAQDMTKRDRIEAELAISEQTLRSLIANSPDAILIVDRQRRIQFVNRNDYGFDEDQLLGAPAESFVPEKDRQRVVDAIDRVLETGEPYTYSTGLSSPVGEKTFVTRVVPIPGEHGTDRLMLVATDVTAQVEIHREKERLAVALQQAQKMDSLGQLTGGVAHDFNNILVAINGNLELARMSADAAGREERIAAALDAVEHAKTVTGRLLAFSRTQTLHPQPVDVRSLIDGMRELLDRTVGEAIRFTIEATPGPTVCRIDPAQLESAVLNLVVNARDAMPDGGELTIVTSALTVGDDDDEIPPGDYVVVEVADEGVGIPPDIVRRVFEPFFTTKGDGRGTGLGLSMVYGFVRQSGGYVRLVSDPGEGTTVRIFLRHTGESPDPLRRPVLAQDPVRGQRELVLVVDDNEMVRSLTAALLEQLGYRTIVAEGADDALSILADDADIDVMVTDVVLSGDTDGFTLADRAQIVRPDLPIVFVSGYPHDVAGGRRPRNPASTILTKPYTTQQLADAVHRCLDGATTPVKSVSGR